MARKMWLLVGSVFVLLAFLLAVLGLTVETTFRITDVSPLLFGLGAAFFSVALDGMIHPVARFVIALVAFAAAFAAWVFLTGPDGPLSLFGG